MSTSTPLAEGYVLVEGYPSVEEYMHLRAATGLSFRNAAQTRASLDGSWYGVYVTYVAPSPEEEEAEQAAAAAAAAVPSNNTTKAKAKAEAVVVAMGRIIGDGGWYFVVADMCTLPAHRRRGLASAVLRRLLARVASHAAGGAPGSAAAYVTLGADLPGRRLYARHGFADTMPGTMGMARMVEVHGRGDERMDE
ncbi:hypothetical protein GGR56DRAFT_680896 [Xylariaceae sp. FL0804]|nr:hypothetical protein GGR56DRAFT_680896 [Xylariaceae sp. FL0804]